MEKYALLPRQSTNAQLVNGLFSSGEDCGFIGDEDENIFEFVDPLLMDMNENFCSLDSEVRSFVVGVYRQKENIVCSPKDIFMEIASVAGGIDEICLPSEKYVKRVIMDNEAMLYFHWHGTFFLYANEKYEPVVAQVNYNEYGGLEIIPYKLEEFNAPLSGLNRQLYVVFSHFMD